MPPEEAEKEPAESPEPSPVEAEAAKAPAPLTMQSEAPADAMPEPADQPPAEAEPPPLPTEPQPSPPREPARPAVDYPTIGRQTRIRKRELRLEKMFAYAREKGKVTNDEIQKLLRVSDATATRYAAELFRRGLVEKVGRGRAAYYRLR